MANIILNPSKIGSNIIFDNNSPVSIIIGDVARAYSPIITTITTVNSLPYVSYDGGVNFEVLSIPGYNPLHRFVSRFGNGMTWLAGANNGLVHYSSDLINWTTTDTGIGLATTAVVSSDGVKAFSSAPYVSPTNLRTRNTATGGLGWYDTTLDTHPTRSINSIAISKDFETIVTAGKGREPRWVSYNSGTNWTEKPLPAGGEAGSGTVRMSANGQYLLYSVNSWSYFIQRSNNGGLTWTTLHTDQSYVYTSRISDDGKYQVYTHGTNGYTDQRFSEDYGSSYSLTSFQGYTVAASDDLEVSINKQNSTGDYYVSRDRLQTFTKIISNGVPGAAYMDPYNKDVMMFRDNLGYHYSHDRGISWNLSNHAQGTHVYSPTFTYF